MAEKEGDGMQIAKTGQSRGAA